MKQVAILLLLWTFVIPGASHAGGMDFLKSRTSEDLQHDLDIVRLKDLSTLSGYIEAYKKITGKYPFEGDATVPRYVHIATKEQEKYVKDSPPYEHKVTRAKDFLEEFQSKLGNDVQLPFDLQRVPTTRPNFYIYMIAEDTYFVAVHLHHEFSFTTKIADSYNKLEITNNPRARRQGVWLRDALLSDPAYIEAVTAKPNKPGYTEQLREKLGGNNAF